MATKILVVADQTSGSLSSATAKVVNCALQLPDADVHVVVFAVWMLFVENNPWPRLTLIVSLEAIFLSTFVMIGQNRQTAFQQAKADHDFLEQERELKTNTDLTRAIHALTKEIHARVSASPPAAQDT